MMLLSVSLLPHTLTLFFAERGFCDGVQKWGKNLSLSLFLLNVWPIFSFQKLAKCLVIKRHQSSYCNLMIYFFLLFVVQYFSSSDASSFSGAQWMGLFFSRHFSASFFVCRDDAARRRRWWRGYMGEKEITIVIHNDAPHYWNNYLSRSLSSS